MSTTNSVAMALDITTTTPVPILVTMAKEDVRLDTVRSVDTDTVTPTPSNNVYEYIDWHSLLQMLASSCLVPVKE